MTEEFLQGLGLAPETAAQVLGEHTRALEEAMARGEQALRREQAEGAARLALAQAGARNVKAARALLAFDPETAQPAEDGAYPGLEEQVAALKAGEATAFLFAGREEPRLSGFRPAEGMALGEEGGAALTLAEAVAQSMNMESD